MADLTSRDARVSWHPYTQHEVEDPPIEVASASGATLTLTDGRELIDAISSWWAILHGHGEPTLVEAMRAQAARLDHVLFAGATHAPAVELAEALVEAAPAGLTRVFYSDDGSTAVEAGLKMVLQRWRQLDEPARTVFVRLRGSYHGDTFGAMSVGEREPFFAAFGPLLFESSVAGPTAASVGEQLDALGDRAAGVLVEPLVQGANGMLMYSEGELRGMRAACDARGLPLVADEVMTGFGRTGALFACERAGITPDVMCLAKGLTGGTLPLAATLATEDIYAAFLSEDRGRAFFHGHTFTAHPIGCAVAIASLRLVRERDVPARLEALGARLEDHLADLRDDSRVADLRRTGGVVALELRPAGGERAGYLASVGLRLRRAAIARGVLLRPLGNVLYAMPPACTNEDQADEIARTMRALVEDA